MLVSDGVLQYTKDAKARNYTRARKWSCRKKVKGVSNQRFPENIEDNFKCERMTSVGETSRQKCHDKAPSPMQEVGLVQKSNNTV